MRRSVIYLSGAELDVECWWVSPSGRGEGSSDDIEWGAVLLLWRRQLN